MMGYGFGFGGLFMVLFCGVLIWAIVVLVRGNGFSGGCCGKVHGHMHGGGKDAMDTLKQRYAKGEITKEQFESMKNDLQ
ncbi:MAG: hypothetical protein ACD_5C00348G0002 [uncultured bacterium]|nr:MAG: hypothetical protein ACD_5C00348G0002 [uncultured bacterium]